MESDLTEDQWKSVPMTEPPRPAGAQEVIEIQIMKLENDIRRDLAELPKWARLLVYLWLRYVDKHDRDELLKLFD